MLKTWCTYPTTYPYNSTEMHLGNDVRKLNVKKHGEISNHQKFLILKIHPKICKWTQTELRLYFKEIPSFIPEPNYWKYLCSVLSSELCPQFQEYQMPPSRQEFLILPESCGRITSGQMVKQLHLMNVLLIHFSTSRTVTEYSHW